VARLIAPALGVYLIVLSVAFPTAQAQPDGKSIFRFDTFGSEQLWTDFLQMQHVIAENVSPKTALSVGLKVDVDALPPALIDALATNQVNLDDPAVTVQLLKLNAVVGVIGKVVGANDNLATVGITCALCHSTVDDSFASGIGKRLDGWANTTLNPGAIIALSPAITETDKKTYRSWGAGKYDPRFRIFDGASPLPLNSPSIPVVIPPAFGLEGVGFETFNGDGPISYWNNYVAVTQMGGHGSFNDPRIGVSVVQTPDQVTPKLPALAEINGAFRRRRRRTEISLARRRNAARISLWARRIVRPAISRRCIQTSRVDRIRACRSSMIRLRFRPTLPMPRAVPRRRGGRHRSVHCGNTHPISTMEAPPIFWMSSTATMSGSRWD
jgi:hypothetical protein